MYWDPQLIFKYQIIWVFKLWSKVKSNKQQAPQLRDSLQEFQWKNEHKHSANATNISCFWIYRGNGFSNDKPFTLCQALPNLQMVKRKNENEWLKSGEEIGRGKMWEWKEETKKAEPTETLYCFILLTTAPNLLHLTSSATPCHGPRVSRWCEPFPRTKLAS